MVTYKIEVKETLSRIIEIEAKSIEEALLKVEEMYKNEEIILDSNDFIDAEILISED